MSWSMVMKEETTKRLLQAANGVLYVLKAMHCHIMGLGSCLFLLSLDTVFGRVDAVMGVVDKVETVKI
jgi:hypothetical protein